MAMVREIREEVGLEAKCISLLAVGNRTSVEYGRNEIFLIFHAEVEPEYVSVPLNIQEDELQEARWMPVNECLSVWLTLPKLKTIQRQALIGAIHKKGMIPKVHKDNHSTLQFSVSGKYR